MAAKSLTQAQKAVVGSLADRGDMIARAAVVAQAGRTSLVSGGTPAAKGTNNVHAALASNAANAFPGPITNPATPRNVRAVFAASYDGGDITLVGTDQFNRAQTEVITAAAASTVVGVKVWKTITSITKATVGATANTVSIGTGDLIGITDVPVSGSPVLLFTNGVAEAVTFNATANGFTPTTVPNGSVAYVLSFNQ